jgi:F0F1-type ATP synthase assembly protein I
MSDTQTKVDPIENFRKKKIQAVKTIAFLNLAVIAVFVVIGFGLDYLFGTKPWLLIVSVVVSFPVTQFVVIKKIRKNISK